MKYLRITLGIIYPILMVMLLLNAKTCVNHSTDNPDTMPNPDPAPVDSVELVSQAEETGGRGNLKVTLIWNFQGDIDLHVKQPNGVTIFYDNAKDPETGGFLDKDNREGGRGAAENVFWLNPPSGEYDVSIVYYQESNETKIAESGICSIVIIQKGLEPRTYQVEMNNVGDHKCIAKIVVR